MDTEYQGQIGIDLGTTYSCVGVWEDDHVEIIPNQEGNKTTPSWVAFTDTEVLVGDSAKLQSSQNPENSVFDVKRLLGKHFNDDSVQDDVDHFPFEVVGDRNDIPTINVTHKGEKRSFKPEQISALVLGKMRQVAEEYLGQRVKKAVITVPAYFNDSQRNATKNAATIAGLVCDKIINEPTAACMCYGLEKKEDNSKVLIFDLGGGTFDVSILNLYNGIFQVLSTSGDTHLGGEDFDNVIVDGLLGEFCKKHKIAGGGAILAVREAMTGRATRKLRIAAEQAKRTLSSAKSAMIDVENIYEGKDLIMTLTRSKLESWCLHLFKRCLIPVSNALDDASLDPDQISDVVLIGGSTRIPKIQELLSEFFGGIQLNKSVNPDEAVAYGAAVQGAILSKQDPSGKTKELLLMDVTPLSLGIESKGGVMSTIISRNSSIPMKESKVYSTVENQQTEVMIKIFEGERKFTKDNHKIGDFELSDIPRQPRGVPKINVTFSIDANGILNVKAVDKETGNTNEVKITNTTRLSQEEINKMVDEAEEFRADDEMKKDALNSRYAFEKELLFHQQSINSPELKTSEEGEPILNDDEIGWMNQFILNNLTWLEENEDVSREKIDEAKRLFTNGTKALMSRIFARKKQLDMAAKYAEQDEEQDLQKISDMAFASENGGSTSGGSPRVPVKIKKRVQIRAKVRQEVAAPAI
jgi:L1 cell adhesion molecule like protein